ncbi:MAG: hypothetical protein ABIK89_11380 [Planctomycetota bacterium]
MLVRKLFPGLLLLGAVLGTRKHLKCLNVGGGVGRRHLLFIVFLVYMNMYSIGNLGMVTGIAIRSGVRGVETSIHLHEAMLPKTGGVIIWVLAQFASLTVLLLASALSQGVRKARRWIVKLLPVIFVLDCFNLYLAALTHPHAARVSVPFHVRIVEFSCAVLFGTVVFGWVYILMHRFYRSEISDPIFCSKT